MLKRLRDFAIAALICWPQPFGLAAIAYLLSIWFPNPTPLEIGAGYFLYFFMFLLGALWAVLPVVMLVSGPQTTLRFIREDVLPSFRF